MPVSEIIDPADPEAETRRRRLLELVGPILGVVLVIIAIVALTLHSYHKTRGGVIALSQDLLREEQKNITREVSDYLAPASATAIVARDLLTDPVTDEPPRVFLAYGASMLRNVSQVESFYLADDRGSFWFIDRAPKDISDGMEWVHLLRDQRIFRHWYYDKQGKLVRTSDTHGIDYDPRQRAWYKGAFERPDLNWSDPYPTAATKQLIVTAASVLHTSDGHQAVFAINISLNRLTDFLEEIKIGKSGQAVVVDKEGRIIAGNRLLDVARKANWQFDKMLLDPNTQPVFSRALSLFRIYGAGVHLIKAHDTQYVTIMASLHKIRPGWVLILNAPEDDFAAFAAAAGRQGLIFSMVIVVLAALLAGFLVRQNRRTERLRRQIGLERVQVRAESQALNAMAGTPNLLDPAQDAPLLSQRLAELAKHDVLDSGVRSVMMSVCSVRIPTTVRLMRTVRVWSCHIAI
ncbi:cache domain-containing protein [Asaia prunellae]|uniref:cache domain-containing protein n=1 Tax=Asaia prunellae TaxID=610245 RepID=UPI000684CF4E|nr:cache domain-containing protein [Asaia prunellae]